MTADQAVWSDQAIWADQAIWSDQAIWADRVWAEAARILAEGE